MAEGEDRPTGPAAALPLEGCTTRLRDWRLSDLPPWAAWLAPGHRWKNLDGPYYPAPTAEEVAAMLARKRTEIEAGTFSVPRTSLVIADRAGDAFLGLVTWAWESVETAWPSTGLVIFDLGPGAWLRGARPLE